MTPAEFDAQLAAFSKTSKVWGLGERETAATELEFAAFERKHGLRLPPEYRYIGLTHGFGDFGFCSLYSIRDTDIAISQWFRQFELPSKFVPVAGNGCGDYYGFLISGGVCKSAVTFADHETGWDLLDTEYNNAFELVAQTGFMSDREHR